MTRMYSIALATLLTVLATITIFTGRTVASETGMASIHTWVKVGKKTCLSGHDHNGYGSGTNQKMAELAAIRSWASFTDLEYGSTWSNFNNAVAKRMSCSRDGSVIQCNLDATPCRPF